MLRLLIGAAFAADVPDDLMRLGARSAEQIRQGEDGTAATLEARVLLHTRARRFLPVHGDRVWWFDVGVLPLGLVEGQTRGADGEPVPPGERAVAPDDLARFGLTPIPELWVLEPGASAVRVAVASVERGSHRKDVNGWGIDLVVGPRAPGSVVVVGPPPASWSARPPPADAAFQARVEADVARRTADLGGVVVGSAFLGRTAWVRMVQPIDGPNPRSLVTDVLYRGDDRVVVGQGFGALRPPLPHHLFDVDGDGRLDVVLTGCATQVLATDGAEIAVDPGC